jgi:hypothetical protein
LSLFSLAFSDLSFSSFGTQELLEGDWNISLYLLVLSLSSRKKKSGSQSLSLQPSWRGKQSAVSCSNSMAFGFLVGHLLDQVYISLAFTSACGRLSAARRNP